MGGRDLILDAYDDPRLADAYGKRAGTTRAELRRLGRLLRDVRRPEVVLDVPCGNGRLAPFLRSLEPHRLLGMDGSREMVGRAAPHYDRVAAADAAALPLPDGAADLVVCMRLLHHFPDSADRVRILQELRRVARGEIVVSYYDSRTLEGLRRRIRPKRRSGRVGLTAARLRADLREAGLDRLSGGSLFPLVREQSLLVLRPRET